MLHAPQTSSSSGVPHRRGHAHRRSAAISGDFDLEFFKPTPSISQQLSTSAPSNNHAPYLTPKTPNNNHTAFTPTGTPSLVITEPDTKPTSTPTPSPKKHTRLNSWAHTLVKNKQNDVKQLQLQQQTQQPPTLTVNSQTVEYSSSSSNENTPELKRQAIGYSYNTHEKVPLFTSSYKVPEAIIDLDLASGVYHDPSTPKSITSMNSRKNIFHRRTESAPELEDFLKYKVFSTNSSDKNSRKNSAIFEEEDEDLEEALSSVSSEHHVLSQNPSSNSLNMVSSSTLATPTSMKTNTSTATRRGVSAKRYENYYNNNIKLSNALKSSESLSNAISVTQTTNSRPRMNLIGTSVSSSSSSITSSIPNSPSGPSGFKFESQIYDMPQKKSTSSLQSPIISHAQVYPTSNKPSTPKKQVQREHKKSNSLFSSISMKLRRNSITATPKSTTKRSTSDNTTQQSQSQHQNQETEEDEEGDSTITPFNLGEPGPELDLSTMTPRYLNDHSSHSSTLLNNPNELNEPSNLSWTNTSSPNGKQTTLDMKQNSNSGKESPKKHHKIGFFSWRKK